MKRLFMVVVVVAVSLVFVGAAFAAGQAQLNTGCGLGKLAWQNKADDSVLFQVFQATTNGTFWSQTFGITSGTSDCAQPKNFASNQQVNEFMVANMDSLARDIAQGRGETLDAFAELLGVPAEKRPEFYGQLQNGFSRIFTSPGVQMASVMDNISTVSK
jgi:hypothetical protein